jgi:hypothetical protein
MGLQPRTSRVRWKRHYRVIASKYPPVDLFERHVPPRMMGALWALEAQTNPRLQQEAGEIALVREEDRVSGPGASVVMAAFTHIGYASRFSDGSYGVYYAGRTLETAVRETVFHRERIASAARLGPDQWSLRAWVGQVRKPLHDLRESDYSQLHDPDVGGYPVAQAFARELRQAGSWGMVYRSVRHPGGHCIAALRPPATTLPVQGPNLVYLWDGDRVTHVYERSDPLFVFG